MMIIVSRVKNDLTLCLIQKKMRENTQIFPFVLCVESKILRVFLGVDEQLRGGPKKSKKKIPVPSHKEEVALKHPPPFSPFLMVRILRRTFLGHRIGDVFWDSK